MRPVAFGTMASPDDVEIPFLGGRERFGEITAPSARAQADDLEANTRWVEREREGLKDDPTSEVLAWRELADELDRAGVTYVRELPERTRSEYARRLGIEPSST
jgi:hypothetical protein